MCGIEIIIFQPEPQLRGLLPKWRQTFLPGILRPSSPTRHPGSAFEPGTRVFKVSNSRLIRPGRLKLQSKSNANSHGRHGQRLLLPVPEAKGLDRIDSTPAVPETEFSSVPPVLRTQAAKKRCLGRPSQFPAGTVGKHCLNSTGGSLILVQTASRDAEAPLDPGSNCGDDGIDGLVSKCPVLFCPT